MVAVSTVKKDETKHLHVKLGSEETDVYDVITLYLEVAGRSPDTFWRGVGRLEKEDEDSMADLLISAFKAGVFLAREHPEEVRTLWVTEKECSEEQKAESREESTQQSRKKESTAFSHYA
ncbi:MAG: hypothetical protein M1144_00620 [Candidatus Thermoplasmatota archaeon]|jgi:hypothetical protein|nr:hypothetical protein [Candidatus Thermoplasmatota archaeon]MCL5984603.1 hypothetical protein [Candidatus Thermoplasmatota archaeon]